MNESFTRWYFPVLIQRRTSFTGPTETTELRQVDLFMPCGTRVEVRRAGSGPAMLTILPPNESDRFSITARDGEPALSSLKFEVPLEAHRPKVLTFDGLVNLGDETGWGMRHLVLGGTVELRQRPLLSLAPTVYTVHRIEVGAGERLVFHQPWYEQEGREPEEPEEACGRPDAAAGFVRLNVNDKDEQGGMLVSLTLNAKDAELWRFQSPDMALSVPWWAKLSNDPVLALLIATLPIGLVIFSASPLNRGEAER